MLRYVELKEKPKDFLAVAGSRLEEFECRLPSFEKCYQLSIKPKPKATRKKKRRAAGGGRKGNLDCRQSNSCETLW